MTGPCSTRCSPRERRSAREDGWWMMDDGEGIEDENENEDEEDVAGRRARRKGIWARVSAMTEMAMYTQELWEYGEWRVAPSEESGSSARSHPPTSGALRRTGAAGVDGWWLREKENSRVARWRENFMI